MTTRKNRHAAWLRVALAFMLCATLALTPAMAAEALDGHWVCSDIVGNVTEDTPARLQDDFYLAVNKDWMLQVKIPDGESSISSFDEIERILKDRQISLMTDDTLTGHDAELVHKLYALVTDWDYRNAQGLEPMMPYIQSVAEIDSLDALTAWLHSENNLSRIAPLLINVMADFSNPDVYVAFVGTHSLTLKDSAEYTKRTAAGDMAYAIAQQTADYMLGKLGYSEEEAQAIFDNAMAYEALLAAHIRPMADQYQSDYISSILNYMTPEELAGLAGDFPVLDMIEITGYSGASRYLVSEPDYIAALSDIYTEENVPLMRDYLLIRVINACTSLLDEQTLRDIETIQNAITGVSGQVSDDDNALSLVNGLLSVPMDNLYIQKYCTEKQRSDILDLIHEVLDAYRVMLNETEWLSEETREKAIEKLDNIRVFAVYPDELGDWSDLDFAGPEDNGSLLEATMAVTRYVTDIYASRIDTAVDKDKWDQLENPAADVNGFYDTQSNSFNIQAGFLIGEFYNEDMSREEQLGAIGHVIGHEISHAFDTDGARYDKDGALNNWWTDEDYAAFMARAEKLIAWYDTVIPMEGATYSGQQVNTEVIADMGSMKALLSIAAQTEDFDYDAFFRQNARMWRTQALESSYVNDIKRDKHPLAYLRANVTLAQFDEFVELYDIQEGDGMYFAPEDRIAVW